MTHSNLIGRAQHALAALAQLHAPHLDAYHQPTRDVMPDIILRLSECEARYEGLTEAVSEAHELLDLFLQRIDPHRMPDLASRIEVARHNLSRWTEE